MNRDAGNRIRTYVSTKLSAPKADPFDRSGIPAVIIVVNEPF